MLEKWVACKYLTNEEEVGWIRVSDMETDAELLVKYADRGDEAAFAVIVERHGSAVYRACLRQLHDVHEAEDAAQAVFMALARKAKVLGRHGDLAAWLHDVARKTALFAIRSRANRARHQMEIAMLKPVESSEPANAANRREALACLDAELVALTTGLRQAVTLRYLEGRSEQESLMIKTMFQRLALILDSIKFAHSIFALPFALIAMIVAARGWPSSKTFALILVCMVSARSAAMAFNRLIDRHIDAANPRTQHRPTVTSAVSPRFLAAFIVACALVFWISAWFLNLACFICALPTLALLLGYSFSKYFTSLCHFWLGLALGLAPVGAHLAAQGDLRPLAELGARWALPFEAFPLLLTVIVMLWVAGFDVIYACQDYAVDCADPRLHSIPKRLGIRRALIVSALLHTLALALLVLTGIYASFGEWYHLAVAAVGTLLIYEHWIVRPTDLSRINAAFFTINGLVSLLLFAAVFVER
ncbi:MAG: UbiA-like polyprenyltransferase [Planctomycetota bacterium]